MTESTPELRQRYWEMPMAELLAEVESSIEDRTTGDIGRRLDIIQIYLVRLLREK